MEKERLQLIRISQSLGVSLNSFSLNEEAFVYQDEIKIIQALREVEFEDYQRFIKMVEAQIYFKAKDCGSKHKEHLQNLMASLSSMTAEDLRPRSSYVKEVKRVRH